MVSVMMMAGMVFSGFLGLVSLAPPAEAHVAEDAGNPLQLYSYFTSSTVTINGDITNNGGGHGNNCDKWKDAYVRTIRMKQESASTEMDATLLLMNDDTNLYVAVIYVGNSGNSNEVRLYFDEGNGTASATDGGHDDALTNPSSQRNENCAYMTAGGTKTDGAWNASAQDWATDGDGATDFTGGVDRQGGINLFEFKVPLDNSKNDDASNSDLDVSSSDELGFYIRIYQVPDNAWYYWKLTNGDYKGSSNPCSDSPGWADIQMGASKTRATVYATYTKSAPTVDGDITEDYSWADCWEKPFKLTNETGTTLNGVIKACEDFSSRKVYLGFVIYDTTFSANDTLRIYTDQNYTGKKQQDYILTDNYENCAIIGYTGGYTDSYADHQLQSGKGYVKWDSGDSGASDATDGAAGANYYTKPSRHYEFEYRWDRYPTTDSYDANTSDYGSAGIMIRYYEGDTDSVYYWMDLGNDDDIVADDTGANSIDLALGWGIIQTGCPKMKLVTPSDGGSVKNSDYTFQVDAAAPGGTGSNMSFVGFRVGGTISWTSLSLTGGDTFKITWDTTQYANGKYEVEILVKGDADHGSVVARRTISVTVANPTSSAPPTDVNITSPSSGPLSNTTTIAARATSADRVEIYVDGAYVNDMLPAGGGVYNYNLDTKNYKDGNHTVRARAVNGAGETSGYKTYEFDNWDPLTSVSIVSPRSGETINGLYNVQVDFEQDQKTYPAPGYADLYVDGSATALAYAEVDLDGTGNWGYNISLNTVWFSDGPHTLKAVVTDPEGNSLTDLILVNFLNKPSVQIISPAGSEVIAGTYNLSIKVSDPNGDPIPDLTDNPVYRVDGGAWSDMGRSLDIANVVFSEVCYNLSSCATAEWVELFNPGASAVNLSGWKISEEGGTWYTFGSTSIPSLGVVTVASNGTAFRALYGKAATCSAGLSSQALGDAGDSLTLKNGAGNTVDYVEWDAPASASWNAPRPSAASNRSIQRNPYVDTDKPKDWLSDVTSVTPNIAAPVGYAAQLDTGTLSDGPHTITFQATDSTGAVATSSVSVNVDNIVLLYVNISRPLAGDTIRNEVTVTAYPYPASQAAWAELYIDNEFAGFDRSLSSTDSFDIKLLTTGFSDGAHNLKVVAYDEYGASVVNVTSVTIQNKPSLYVVWPQENMMLRGSVPVEVTASDLDGILDNASLPHFRVDGADDWQPMSYNATSDTYVADGDGLDTTTLLDGMHTLEIEVIDNGTYHISTGVKLKFQADNTLPTAFLVTPSGNQTVEGKFTFQVSATDNVGVDHVDLAFENLSGGSSLSGLVTRRMTYNVFSGYYEFIVDTAVFTDGPVNITFEVFDKAGNSNGTVEAVGFFVDNNAPYVAVDSPSQGDFVGGLVDIALNISDGPYTPDAEYRIDGGPWQEIDLQSGLTVSWNTSRVTDGKHTISVRAMDRLRHTTTVDVDVMVDNNNPYCDLVTPLSGQFVEGVLVFRAGASDALGLSNVTLTFDGKNYTMTYNGLSRQYDYSVNTLGLPDGTYNATVTAVDLSGRTTVVGPIDFHVDNNDPTLSVNSPEEGGFVEGVWTIDVTSRDAFPGKVIYRIGAGEWVPLSASGDTWTAQWNTSALADGSRSLTIWVVDGALHRVERIVTVFVDNHAPVASIAAPVSNQYVEGTFTFQVMAADQVGIEEVSLELHGGSVRATQNALTGMYEYRFDTLVWTEDNIRNVSATVTDRSGKSVSLGPVFFRVDNHAPVLSIESPQAGDYVEGLVEMRVNVTDAFPGPTEYNVDGAGWIAAALPWNTTMLADGSHRLAVRSRDLAGHSTEQEFSVIVDNHDPACIVSAPLQKQFAGGVFRFQLSASDRNGISLVRMDVFNLTVNLPYNAQTGYYEYTVDTLTVEDGVYNLTAFAVDSAGRRTDAPNLTFMVDNNPPAVTVNSPRNGDYISDEVVINVTAEDRFPGAVVYTVDDAGWVPVSRPLNTTLLSDGEHTIGIRASDQAAHAVVHTVTVFVNNLAPQVTVLEPMEGAHLHGSEALRVYSAGSVRKVFFALDNETYREIFRPVEGSPYYTVIDTTLLPDGNHTVRAKSVDFAGHESEAAVSVVVDNSGPSMLVRSPRGQKVGLTSFTVNATDLSKVVRVQVNIDGRGWRDLLLEPNGLFVYRWPTDSHTNGEHTYQFLAEDELGNTAVLSGKFTVKNEPDWWRMFMDALPLFAFVFLMVLVILLMVMVRYGRLQRWIKQDIPPKQPGTGFWSLRGRKGGKGKDKAGKDAGRNGKKAAPEDAGKAEEAADEDAGEKAGDEKKEEEGDDDAEAKEEHSDSDGDLVGSVEDIDVKDDGKANKPGKSKPGSDEAIDDVLKDLEKLK
jgi:hypothetical protein